MDEEKIKNLINVKEFVYGAMDGVVTTFSIVTGVIGANLSASIILILGFAKLFADAISMSVGNYMSVKSEHELYLKEKKREEKEVKTIPNEEIREIEKIYKKKGFKGKELQMVVNRITSNKRVWVDTMMREELGLFNELINPIKSALITLFSFILIGLIPLIGFIISQFIPLFSDYAFIFSIIVTLFALFLIGAIKGKIVQKNMIMSGLETTLVGGVAALTAYLIGYVLQLII